MEVLALYPANSLFLQGYLNARGSSNRRTLQMIQDAGFTIKSEVPLGTLLQEEFSSTPAGQDPEGIILKDLSELRPYRSPATTSSPKSCASSG
jgi:biotin synthase